MTKEMIKATIKGKVSLDIPVVFDVDFGHVSPMLSFPAGGKVQLSAWGNIDTLSSEHYIPLCQIR